MSCCPGLSAAVANAPAAGSLNSSPPASVTATRAPPMRARLNSSSTGVRERRLELHDIDALMVAAYVEQLGSRTSKPTVKQHLAAIRQLFAYLTSGGILEVNPAASVRGPKYVVKRGKTPVLSALKPASYSTQLKVTL